MLHKSVEWFLYNGSIGLNGKVDALLRSMFLFRYMFFFISNSTFHLCLSSLQKNYDLSLKVVKKVLSITFKFSMISAQYVPLKAFFIDFMSFVNIVKLLFCLSGVICQKRKYFTGLLSLSCVTFQIFSLASCFLHKKISEILLLHSGIVVV